MDLVTPTLDRLPAYVDALKRGWSPDNLNPSVVGELLERLKADPAAFVAGFEDREAKGPPIRLPDGSLVPRLPGLQRWIWQDGFCGSIGLRWQTGTEALPPHCLGHIGYAVVPWRRNRGLASAALRAILPEAASAGLRYVEITTSPDNAASVKVIGRAGGVLVERFEKPASLGGGETLRFRIDLRRDGSAAP